MFHAGLIWKYKVNRPLTESERRLQLRQDERLDVEPADESALIGMNSTFLESLDKYYMEKGWLTLCLLVALVLLSILSFGMSLVVSDELGKESPSAAIVVFSLVVFLILVVPMLVASAWGISKEAFRFTHYPIRLNRKNRMVYVFRQDRTVLSVPWGEVFFTLNKENSRPRADLWEIQGHVLGSDGLTVRETFSFSDVADHGVLRRHWEFLRRYMDEGPGGLVGRVRDYAPVDKRKETFGEGFARLIADDVVMSPVAAVVFSPFTFLQACARWIVMRTCAIPKWPAEIEEACKMEPDDPWARDARNSG